ncbi:MAG: hypothetical protein M3O41_15270 [Pseudomonadota bacterium]|nr:hypothetical protein [Pseudomonadota bacterium]
MIRNFRTTLLAVAITALSGAGTRGGTTAAATASTNWEVMVWTAPLTVSLDASSIALHAARVTARVLWDYSEVQYTGGHATAPYKSMVGVIVFDCVTEQFGGAGSVSYSGDGGEGDAVAQYSINPDSAALSNSDPGTIGHDLLTFVCAHAYPVSTRQVPPAGEVAHTRASSSTAPFDKARTEPRI